MAKMIQVPYDHTITLPVATAQSVQGNRENPISLKSLGLLVNLLSYSSTWELHKTELYKRFGKDGEKSVKAAWNDLVDTNYIIEFRYRVGKKYEYVYYFRKVPFRIEEKEDILAKAEKEYGQVWGLRNGDPKMETPKGRDNKDLLLNKDPLLNKEEEAPPSELVSFLLSKNHAYENATKFETRLLKEGLPGYTNEDVLTAIEKSLADFHNGICDEPYIWAVGKLKRILDNKGKGINITPQKPKRKATRTERLPDWFDQTDTEEPKKTENTDLPSIEDMMKQLREGNKE